MSTLLVTAQFLAPTYTVSPKENRGSD